MKDRYVWGEYVVASIDVLGQKCQFDRIKDLIIDEIPQETLDDVARKTIRSVELVRNELEELFLWSQKAVEPRIAVAEADRAEYDKARKTTPIRFQFYSDTVLAYVALRTTGYQWNDLSAVRDMLISVGGTLLIALAEETSFRAAVEIGIGTDLENGDLYGPIRAEAYELEDQKADYPRVIVGNRFYEYLKSFSEGRPRFKCNTETELRGSRSVASMCMKMLANDPNDGFRILDYLGGDFILRDDGAGREIYGWARRYIEKVLRERSSHGLDAIYGKFVKLRNYFDSRPSPR